jgi:hypothetical protein
MQSQWRPSPAFIHSLQAEVGKLIKTSLIFVARQEISSGANPMTFHHDHNASVLLSLVVFQSVRKTFFISFLTRLLVVL